MPRLPVLLVLLTLGAWSGAAQTTAPAAQTTAPAAGCCGPAFALCGIGSVRNLSRRYFERLRQESASY